MQGRLAFLTVSLAIEKWLFIKKSLPSLPCEGPSEQHCVFVF
jgi:hypothetical protein